MKTNSFCPYCSKELDSEQYTPLYELGCQYFCFDCRLHFRYYKRNKRYILEYCDENTKNFTKRVYKFKRCKAYSYDSLMVTLFLPSCRRLLKDVGYNSKLGFWLRLLRTTKHRFTPLAAKGTAYK